MSDSEEPTGPDNLEETVDSLLEHREGILRSRSTIETAFETLKTEDLNDVGELGDNVIYALLPEYEHSEAVYVKNTLLLAMFNIDSGIIEELSKAERSQDEEGRDLCHFIANLANRYVQHIAALISRQSIGENFWTNIDTQFWIHDETVSIRHLIRIAYEETVEIDFDIDSHGLLLEELARTELNVLTSLPEEPDQLNREQTKSLIETLSNVVTELEDRLPDEPENSDPDA